MLTFGALTFKNKTQALKGISEYLQTHSFIPEEDYPSIVTLFQQHPKWATKSQNLERIGIHHNRGTNAFVLIKQDGSVEDISYRKCINGTNSLHDENKAMRDDVIPQILAFRQQSDLSQCSLCGISIETSRGAHIDHVIRFKDLKQQFKASPDVIHTISLGSHRTISDPHIRLAWQEFHRKNAVLRVLCTHCNLSVIH